MRRDWSGEGRLNGLDDDDDNDDDDDVVLDMTGDVPDVVSIAVKAR